MMFDKHFRLPALFLLILCCLSLSAHAQDTVQVSLEAFIQQGLDNSGQLDYERKKVKLADNQIDKARAQRFLPKFELNTQHGTVPGVKTDTDLSDNELYLDPNLENDWENWAIFTRVEVQAIQPIYTWGALSNAVLAAKSAAEATQHKYKIAETEVSLKLYELYYSYLLSLEIQRLLDEAQTKIDKIEKQIKEKRESGDSDLDESELYKFDVYKSEFAMRAAEVRESMNYIRSVWDYVMQPEDGTVYKPKDRFLDRVVNPIESLDFYKSSALEQRSELKGIEAGIKAAEHGVEATKAQNLPMLYIGLTGSYANTPNRPRQSNPFIINNTNYASAGVGFGIRQNLDFFSVKTDIEHRKIQYRQAKDLKYAAIDGIMLEIFDRYKEVNISDAKVNRTDEALVTSKKWLRQEQLDYDFGIGNTKDLIDAMKKELELRLSLKQRIFEFNKDMAQLYRASGIPLRNLSTVNQ